MPIPTQAPLFSSQWYLKNTGQRGAPGVDINVTPVWTDYTGKGVLVGVNDDGMDLSHPDLLANLRLDLVYDTPNKTTGKGFAAADSSHGTVVGSIIGMVNNGIGGVGVAYDVQIAPALAFGGKTSDLFLANLANGVAVSVNSWGKDPAFAENFSAGGDADDQAWGAAMLRDVTEGRGGLGMVIEVSGGNERGNRADTSMSNFTGARYTIAVGAVDNLGVVTSYSSNGASLLVNAPGGSGSVAQSVNEGYGIVSADIAGTGGYNKTAGEAGDYAYNSQGTSYSGPMVAGIAALMLQANPKLGFRDVANILALTARQTDATNASWVHTAGTDWNMGSMHFSRDYGFGLVDANAAVHLAESWNVAAGTMANWQVASAAATHAQAVIPELTGSLDVTMAMTQNVRIERIELDLGLTSNAPNQLGATLTSPSGTTVTLFERPLTQGLADGAPTGPQAAWPGVFTIGATTFLGEMSAGTWTLRLFDLVTGEAATYSSATVKAYGSAVTNDNNMIFTNEFTGSKTLTDSGGIDTINAAAMSAALAIDLRPGAKSTLGTGDFTIAASSQIENAIGGDGADHLIGNDLNNVLRGNRGNDIIDGGLGLDTALYTNARAGYTVTKTDSGLTVTDNRGSEGVDTLTGVERLRFGDTGMAFDITGNGGTAYRIYQAAFNRTPDLGGLGFWISVLDKGLTSFDIAAGFVNSDEFKTVYGASQTNLSMVTQFYQNILHRAPEAAGRDYWVNALDTHVVNTSQVLSFISDSAENQAGLAGIIGNGFAYTPYLG